MAGKQADGSAREGSNITDLQQAPPLPSVRGMGLNQIKGSDTAWMSPSNSLQPQVPSASGRQFDYPVAVNLMTTPRGEMRTSFATLRGMADAYAMVRLAVETRKDQIVKMKPKFKPFDPKDKPDKRCDDLTLFFKTPNKRNTWREWLRMLVEDLLVIDAPTLLFHPNLGGRPYAFEIMDGATVKLLYAPDGRPPLPPQPAYQQNFKGIPAVNYMMPTPGAKKGDLPQLIYKPNNLRSWSMYGFSPVEQILMIVNIGLRREISQLQFYTEGNVPEALISTPNTWSPAQIKEYQLYWDSIMEGNTAQRRHAKFVPGGMDVHDIKTAALIDPFDEWLARVVQYCFSLPATPYVKQVNKGETTNMKEQAEEEGLVPLMDWVADMINYLVVTYWGYTDIGFCWEEENDIDPLTQAQVNQIYLQEGVLMPDEVRADLGKDPLTPEQLAAQAAAKQPPPMLVQGADEDGNPTGEPQPKVAPGGKTPPGKAAKPAPAATKTGASPAKGGKTQKVALPGDLKKNTVAKLSPANVKRAKVLAGVITKALKKAKPGVIKQVVAAYGKIAKADDNGDTISSQIALDFTAVLQVTAKNLNAAAYEGSKKAISRLPDDLDLNPASIAEGVGDYRAAELVGKKYDDDGDLVDNPDAKYAITDGTRNLVAGDIDTAMKEGWTTDQLADALEENYAFSEGRAETIARTEIARADMQGSMKTYRESKVVTGKQWLLAEDPCDICQDNADDGIIDLDDDFTSGDDAAPAHPNCECDVTPIVGEDDEDDDETEDNEED